MNESRGQFFYGLTQEYGKNRVQFNDFDWVFYRFDNMDVYFYRGNEELASQVARMAQQELAMVENYLDAPLDDRLQLLVFNNLSDLKQSNVNSSSEDDYNKAGVTRLSGRRLFIYFDGDYVALREHLRSGLTEVVLANMIYGNFTQSITNSALLNLPSWYTEGLVSFMGSRWNPEVNRAVQDGFYSGKYEKLNSLMEMDARHAGHSFWYYIAETYGDKVIRNIVYMSVVNRDIESGFLYILGQDMGEVTKGWRNYFRERYNREQMKQRHQNEEALLKSSRKKRYVRMALSPDEKNLAFVRQRFSRYQVYLYNLEEDDKDRLLTGGYRIAQNADYSYPLLAWHPNGKVLAMFTEEKGFIYLTFYNLEKDEFEKKKFFRFDKIRSVQYSEDGQKFLLSAVQDGQSDIFVYNIRNTKITAITKDSYNDLHPTFFDNDRRIAWSSNRPIDSLYPNERSKDMPSKRMNIFATENRALDEDSLAVWRMTEGGASRKWALQEYEPGYITFLSDHAGVTRQHLIKVDSSISFVDTTTHYDYHFSEYQATENITSLVAQSHAPQSGKRYDMELFDQRYRIYERPRITPEDLNLKTITKQGAGTEQDEDGSGRASSQELRTESGDRPLYYPGYERRDLEVDITNYDFGEAGEEKEQEESTQEPPETVPLLPRPSEEEDESSSQEPEEEEELEIPPKRNYFLTFYQDELNARFDFMFNNQQYQPFTGQIQGNLLNQGFNANLKVGVMDLMHDYRLMAGVRSTFQPLPGTSLAPNSEMLFAFGDFKDRLNKTYTYRRRSQVQFLTAVNYQRLISNEFEAKTIWPFNPVASLHGSLGFRLDEDIAMARDFGQLDEPIQYRSYAIGRLAYVYDNSRKIGLNLYAGLRYKVFTEYYRNLYSSATGLHTAGFDGRHYTVLHRNLIWANRLAAGTSWGPEKLIHIMGGVDNDFSPNSDPSTPIARDNNYIFQTLITNMRGFFQNARNGNHFGVINSEVRWPFVSYFANKPVRNDFLNSLMLVGFADVGTAWNGPSPYAEENAINTREVPLGNEGIIVLDSQKEPIIVGTGLGLRTRIFGYYVRADWAYGIEDGIVLPRVIHISIGMDF